MNNETAKQRILEHIKKLREVCWPKESNDQLVERLVEFADTDRDTERYVSSIKSFFPNFLDQLSRNCPAATEEPSWIPLLVSVLMQADDDDDEALFIVFTAIYYYCINPEWADCGFDYEVSGTLVGHFLRSENQTIRDLINEIVMEMIWFIPSYSLFPVCVIHLAIQTVQTDCESTIDLLKKTCHDSLVEAKRTHGYDMTIGMENFASDLLHDMNSFSFDLWWRCMHSVLPLHGHKEKVETAVNSFKKDLKQWLG